MALNQSPENQSQKKTKEIITSLSPDHIFPDSNAIDIGGKNKRRRHMSMLDIQDAKRALKRMKAEVEKKREETCLMRTELAQEQAAVEEMESVLYQIKGRLYGMY